MNNITLDLFKKYFPIRTPDSYKNLNGKVLIVAGSKNMPGAAILSARAAYRAGAGFVTLAVPKSIASAAAAAVPEAVILKLSETGGQLNETSLKMLLTCQTRTPHDIILIGPGLAKGAKIMPELLEKTKLPAVIDADALNYLAEIGANKLPRTIPYILTPHEGEMQRLLKKHDINKDTAAQELYTLSGAVSMLKGPQTKVCYKDETFGNTTGNEGLAKAGSGDTLAGIIAAIYAQLVRKDYLPDMSQKAFYAALMGVYLHGLAADKAALKYGKISLMATDVAEELATVLKENFN